MQPLRCRSGASTASALSLPSNSFTHIHQIKAYDGDSGSPLVTLTPRFGNPNTMQLFLITSTIATPPAQTITLTQAPLAPFLGEWVEAYEKITYNHTLEEGATNPGRYSIVINRLSDNATVFSYSSDNIDMWRVGTTTSGRNGRLSQPRKCTTASRRTGALQQLLYRQGKR